MKKNILIPAVLIAVLLFLVFFKPFYGWWLRSFFEPQTGVNAGLDLRLENEKLKSEIAKFKIIKSQAPAAASEYFMAMVYSRYPFNFKKELLVNIGGKDGVSENKPVLFDGVLAGRVKKVFYENAVVQTVFDNEFRASVGVGNAGVSALFEGGSLPKLSLIPLSGPVAEGDVVYSASPDFPYGLPIGEVEKVSISSDHLFREASLKFAYDLNDVKAVLIKK